MESALLFLVSHEVTHIADGHVDYWDKHYGLPALGETGWMGLSKSEVLTRQSLEINADVQGTATVILSYAPAHAPNYVHQLSLEQRVFASVFSICWFFHLFEDGIFIGQELAGAHPPFRIREMNCIDAAIDMVNHWAADVRAPCLNAIINAANYSEQSFHMLTGRPVSILDLRQAFGEEGTAYVEELLRHQISVTRPALLPFKFYDFEPQLSPDGRYFLNVDIGVPGTPEWAKSSPTNGPGGQT
jgi:hypothetical protein